MKEAISFMMICVVVAARFWFQNMSSNTLMQVSILSLSQNQIRHDLLLRLMFLSFIKTINFRNGFDRHLLFTGDQKREEIFSLAQLGSLWYMVVLWANDIK
jgi:hypothetical protein